jgi:hypothetical protein
MPWELTNFSLEIIMKKLIFGVFISIVLTGYAEKSNAQVTIPLRIVSDFPGGNILVEKISKDTVYLNPDLRDTQGDWFYWYFGVRNAAGRTLTFQFADIRKLAAFGPAASLDRGKTWNWRYNEHGVRTNFRYSFKANDEVRFCLAVPYLQQNLDAFLKKHDKDPNLRKDTLCITPRGRAVEQLFIGKPGATPEYKVLITARHHACEMMAGYELEGIMDAVLSNNKDMRWLRKNVEFMIIPFVDKDGVEDGDQGKNRNGRDHNRDYGGKSLYVETAAIREKVPEWAGGKLKMVFDLHCPYVNATTVPRNETIYITESGNANIALQQRKWMEILEKNRKGELTFKVENSLMTYGTDWNKASNFIQGGQQSFTGWVRASLPEVPMSTTIEFPYAVSNGQMITPENGRDFGRDVAKSIAIYLQQLNQNLQK